MPIDLSIIVIIRLFIDLTIVALFYGVHVRHPSIGGPGWWSLGGVASLVGTMALAFSVVEVHAVPVALGFTAVSASFGLGWLGLRSFLNKPTPWRWLLVAMLLLFVMQTLLVSVWDSIPARRTLFTVVVILLSALTLRDIRSSGAVQGTPALAYMQWLLRGVIVLLSLLIVRVWLATSVDAPNLMYPPGASATLLLTLDLLSRAGICIFLVFSRLKQQSDQAHEALRERAEASRQLLDNMAAGVIVSRPDQTLVSINAAAREFWSWPNSTPTPLERRNLLGDAQLLCENGQPFVEKTSPFFQVVTTGKTVSNCVVGARHPGSSKVRWALCNAYPEFNATGEIKHVVLTFVDITSLRLAQQQQQTLELQLAQSQKMESLGTLAGGVAHDFNNILAAILGNADLARQDLGDDHPARESLSEITAAARRGRELVRQILAFSRQQPMSRELVHVSSVVDETCRLLRAALAPNVTLNHVADGPVPPILFDATQLGQVLLNLGTNAIYALGGRPGQVTYRVETLSHHDARVPAEVARSCQAADVDVVSVSVADTGAGMDESTCQRIFEPFFTTKPVGQGTGLGLPVVLGIVQAHGGAIEVASQPGEGTRFILYFAATQDTNAAAPGVQPAAALGDGGTMETQHRKKAAPDRADVVIKNAEDVGMSEEEPNKVRHIMYLDDDDTLVFLVQRLLMRRGYKVSSFTEQDKAIEAVRNDPDGFHLLLTDYNMPGMSGIEVARQVLALSPALPVAVASGYITDELKNEALAVGVSEVVFKTDAVEAFCDVVARLVR